MPAPQPPGPSIHHWGCRGPDPVCPELARASVSAAWEGGLGGLLAAGALTPLLYCGRPAPQATWSLIATTAVSLVTLVTIFVNISGARLLLSSDGSPLLAWYIVPDP